MKPKPAATAARAHLPSSVHAVACPARSNTNKPAMADDYLLGLQPPTTCGKRPRSPVDKLADLAASADEDEQDWRSSKRYLTEVRACQLLACGWGTDSCRWPASNCRQQGEHRAVAWAVGWLRLCRDSRNRPATAASALYLPLSSLAPVSSKCMHNKPPTPCHLFVPSLSCLCAYFYHSGHCQWLQQTELQARHTTISPASTAVWDGSF